MKKLYIGWFIIGSALIFGMTIIGAAIMMPDFESKQRVINLLGAGAGIHLIVIWGPLAAMVAGVNRKMEKAQKEEEGEE